MYPRTVSDPVTVDVHCYGGYQGEETPRRFRLGDRQVEIEAVVERWRTPDHRGFKVTAGGQTYALRHDVASGVWRVRVVRRFKPIGKV